MSRIITQAALLAGVAFLSTPAFAGWNNNPSPIANPGVGQNQFMPQGAIPTTCIAGFNPNVTWVMPGNGYTCKSAAPACIMNENAANQAYNGKDFVYTCEAPPAPTK